MSSKILITEAEVIVNYMCLTTEKFRGVKSQTLLPPTNFLTMKTCIILLPPGVFSRLDLYFMTKLETCAVHCWRILVKLEKVIPLESARSTKSGYKQVSIWGWICCSPEGRPLGRQMVYATVIHEELGSKDIVWSMQLKNGIVTNSNARLLGQSIKKVFLLRKREAHYSIPQQMEPWK